MACSRWISTTPSLDMSAATRARPIQADPLVDHLFDLAEVRGHIEVQIGGQLGHLRLGELIFNSASYLAILSRTSASFFIECWIFVGLFS